MQKSKPEFKKPPFLAEKILRMMLSGSEKEGLSGDFEEIYKDIVEKRGRIRAWLWYWLQVIRYFPGFIHNSIYWSVAMLNNYLKVAFRNMRRHKSYTFINVTGLALGITCCILIILFIQNELSYDDFHEDSDRIYRVVNKYAKVFPAIGPAIKADYPQVEVMTRFIPEYRNELVQYKDKKFYEQNILFIEPSFFEIFNYPLVLGNPKTVLENSSSVLLTEKMAQKYFGKNNPLGKKICFGSVKNITISSTDHPEGKIETSDEREFFTVTGIVKNPPENSHFTFDFLISLKLDYEKQMAEFNKLPEKTKKRVPNYNPHYNWSSLGFFTYIKLHKSINRLQMDKMLSGLYQRHVKDKRRYEYILKQFHNLFLQPVTKIHLNSNIGAEIEVNTGYEQIRLFSLIAIIILIIACFNFINLSTSRASTRFKEVGLRKVKGASRMQLIQQFLGESVLICFIATLLSIILVFISLPLFNMFVGKELFFNIIENPVIIIYVISLVLFIGIAAGSYPAFFLSSFQPSSIFRKSYEGKNSRALFRKGFVTLQFIFSIVFITFTLTIKSQLDFIHSTKLGYNTENIITLPIWEGGFSVKYNIFKNELLKNQTIRDVTGGDNLLSVYRRWNALYTDDKNNEEDLVVSILTGDVNCLEFFGIELSQGNYISKDIAIDRKSAVMLNETAVYEIGWENPLGKHFSFSDKKQKKVMGVIKDCHFASLYNIIKPLVVCYRENNFRYAYIKVHAEKTAEAVVFLKEKWEEFSPGNPFLYSYLDVDVEKAYQNETKLAQLYTYSSFIAIFIACLGLFGLASYTADRRSKEIGIRKVFGASVSNIVKILSNEFIKLIIIAIAISFPVCWYIIKNWLQNFAYRIDIYWWIFLSSGILALIIVLLVVSHQAVIAAKKNPIESLRYE